jgi:hypothetical protein
MIIIIKIDQEASKLTAWTTRKDYPTLVGISLPVRDCVGADYHEIQFWEESTEPVPIREQPASEMHDWLIERLRGRAEHGILPGWIPDTFTDLSVRTYRDGKAGYILFELLDSFAASLSDMPCRVQIGYEFGDPRL